MARREDALELGATQRRLWQLVTAPEGVETALSEAGDRAGATLEGWLVSDAILPARERLEVYAGAYFFRIRDVLAEDYPALAAALGEDGFHDLVTAYLCTHPPRHPSLREAGAPLAGYLASAPGAAPFRRRWPWAADLARLEWALVCAFDAPDAPPLSREALAALAPGCWPELRLRFDASVCALHLDWPVHELRDAFLEGAPMPRLEAPRATAVCAWRRREHPRHRLLEFPEAELLDAALEGAPFEALCQLAARTLGEREAPAYAAGRLERWLRDELLTGFDLSR